MGKAEVEAVDRIYNVAKSDAEIEIALLKDKIEAVRVESEALGKVKAIDCNTAFNTLHRYAVLYQIKQKKEYKSGGMTWFEFCEAIGEPQRTVDRILSEIKPLVEDFSAKLADSIGLPFNKIRYLGMSVSGNLAEIEDGCLLFDGQKIPFAPENKDEIEAAIDAMKEAAKTQIEDKDATLKAKDKILQAKERVIQKQEKEIQRYERTVKERGFEPGEEKFIKTMENLKITAQGVLLQLETRVVPDDATVFMQTAYMEAIGYIARAAATLYGEAVDEIGMKAEVAMQMMDDNAPKWTQPEE